MGIVDKELLVSDAQALTATAVSTNAIALGATGLDIAAGEKVGITFQVDVAADYTTTDETYEFQIVTATASNLTTGQDIIVAEAVSAASSGLAAGTKFTIYVPSGRIASTATHIGARYVLGGTTPSVTVTAFLTPAAMVQDSRAPFRSGYTVAS